MNKKIFSIIVALMAIASGAQAQNSIDGHAYVDLGLPSGTLWATMNVGATTGSEQGTIYFDAPPTHTWGDAWEFPTKEQFNELCSNCTIVRHEKGDALYYVLTSNFNSQTITIPGGKWYNEPGPYWNYWIGFLYVSEGSEGKVACGYDEGSTDFYGIGAYSFGLRLIVTPKTISDIPNGWTVNGETPTNGKVKALPSKPITVTPANIPEGKKVKGIYLLPAE